MVNIMSVKRIIVRLLLNLTNVTLQCGRSTNSHLNMIIIVIINFMTVVLGRVAVPINGSPSAELILMPMIEGLKKLKLNHSSRADRIGSATWICNYTYNPSVV